MFFNQTSSSNAARQSLTWPCLLSLCYGSAIGWMSPVQTFLESDRSPVGRLTAYDVAYLAGIPYVGSILGTFGFARVSEHIGRKTMLCGLAIPYLLAGVVIYFTHSFLLMLAARFVIGVCIPGTLSSITLYLSEISDPSILGKREREGESRTTKSKQSLSWLRNTSCETVLDAEIDRLRKMFFNQTSSSSAARQSLTWREVFATPYYWKSFLLGVFLQSSQSSSGIMVLNTFCYTILAECMNHPGEKETQVNKLYPVYLLILCNIAGVMALFIADKFSRKFILIGTRLVCSVFMLFLGVLLLMKDYFHVYIHAYYFVGLLALYEAIYGLGLSSIVFVIYGELFSVECRDKFMQPLLLCHFINILLYITLYRITVRTTVGMPAQLAWL
ncbi:uncharacterized protein LOC103518889, partial [Diaphorina citri]|uniref:Uncharacterized protein LOC103518889 n=1 Tax=Diaphorina citri TaxID=121845 RepID=A0A3Q0JCX2_DIACI